MLARPDEGRYIAGSDLSRAAELAAMHTNVPVGAIKRNSEKRPARIFVASVLAHALVAEKSCHDAGSRLTAQRRARGACRHSCQRYHKVLWKKSRPANLRRMKRTSLLASETKTKALCPHFRRTHTAPKSYWPQLNPLPIRFAMGMPPRWQRAW